MKKSYKKLYKNALKTDSKANTQFSKPRSIFSTTVFVLILKYKIEIAEIH